VDKALSRVTEQADLALELMSDLLMLSQSRRCATVDGVRRRRKRSFQGALDMLPGLEDRGGLPIHGPTVAECAGSCGPAGARSSSNLLGNALKFAGQRARPMVRIDASTRAGEHVCFTSGTTASDSTRGLAQRLFLPFQALHGSAYAGHGLRPEHCAAASSSAHGGPHLVAARSPGNGQPTMQFSLPRQLRFMTIEPLHSEISLEIVLLEGNTRVSRSMALREAGYAQFVTR